jgi:transposase-like protein
MGLIVPDILSLPQPLETLEQQPVRYRPVACPHCGLAKPWGHGCYQRKADRRPGPDGSLNLIPIPRYRCSGCRQTCSRLPECVAPRRWYAWAIQQRVLLWLLAGGSLHQAAAHAGVERRTARRWWVWLQTQTTAFGVWLRARIPDWGRAAPLADFWLAVLAAIPLSRAMAWLDQAGVAVP